MYDRAEKPASPQRSASVKPTREHRRLFEAGAAEDRAAVVAFDLRTVPLWNPATRLPTVEDVNQGEVGDCWVLATLASLAHLAPEYLTSLVELQENGRYLVHLDKDVEVGPLVDCRGYGRGGPPQPLYADFRRAAWVPVMEKAFARRDIAGRLEAGADPGDSYDLVCTGTPLQVMRAFASGPTRRIPMASSCDPMGDLDDLERLLGENRLVVANIAKDGDNHSIAVLASTATGFLAYDPHGTFIDFTEEEFTSKVGVVFASGVLRPGNGVGLSVPTHRSRPSEGLAPGRRNRLVAPPSNPRFALPPKPVRRPQRGPAVHRGEPREQPSP